jgi:hypothetical protein
MALYHWFKITTRDFGLAGIVMAFTLMSIAQEGSSREIMEAFKEYGATYREQAYVHLNKSTYLKGEMIGFSSYVLDKELKIPSARTTNLYCVITNDDNEVVKSKMIKMSKGFANNVFVVDSLFDAGTYTFRAYTNWMRNFSQPDYYQESFRVIDTEEVYAKETNGNSNGNLDAQFLPEGGHLVHNVGSNVGVIIKNEDGLGVAQIEGAVYDSKNNLKASFKTNDLGIGRFFIIPEFNEQYAVRFSYNKKDYQYNITNIKTRGISIQLKEARDVLAVELNTNDPTLSAIEGELFTLFIHNGVDASAIDVSFDGLSKKLMFQKDKLFQGINILSLFNARNQLVLERLFFNYDGIDLVKIQDISLSHKGDSTTLRFRVPKFENSSEKHANISVSILPEETISYERHHSIFTQTYLQSYVNGVIEKAGYYFSEINPRTKYALDNLLITQGWSAYNWDEIFNEDLKQIHPFEDGITVKATSKNPKYKDFIVYPSSLSNGMVFNLEKEQEDFVIARLYPLGNENLGVGTLSKNGKVKPADLNIQYFPSRIPELIPKKKPLALKSYQSSDLNRADVSFDNLDGVQVLEEITIRAKEREDKINRLRNDQFARVDVFDTADRRLNMTLANYINAYVREFIATESGGSLNIRPRVPRTLLDSANSGRQVVVYLDDMLISNLDFFYAWYMTNVDFVAINRSGSNEGFFGANGVIRIYTSGESGNRRRMPAFKKYQYPVTFAGGKTYYTPKYQFYNDAFYKSYGVMGWVPEASVDSKGYAELTFYNPAKNTFKLFIEGINANGDIIVDEKIVDLSKNE